MLEGCMAMMAARGFRHLSPGRGQGRGRDLDRRRRQGHHPGFGAQRGRPDGLHHEGRPRGLTDEPGCRRPVNSAMSKAETLLSTRGSMMQRIGLPRSRLN